MPCDWSVVLSETARPWRRTVGLARIRRKRFSSRLAAGRCAPRRALTLHVAVRTCTTRRGSARTGSAVPRHRRHHIRSGRRPSPLPSFPSPPSSPSMLLIARVLGRGCCRGGLPHKVLTHTVLTHTVLTSTRPPSLRLLFRPSPAFFAHTHVRDHLPPSPPLHAAANTARHTPSSTK